jgi:hypothetical protein
MLDFDLGYCRRHFLLTLRLVQILKRMKYFNELFCKKLNKNNFYGSKVFLRVLTSEIMALKRQNSFFPVMTFINSYILCLSFHNSMSWPFKSDESDIWTPLPDIIVFCMGKSCRPLGMPAMV